MMNQKYSGEQIRDFYEAFNNGELECKTLDEVEKGSGKGLCQVWRPVTSVLSFLLVLNAGCELKVNPKYVPWKNEWDLPYSIGEKDIWLRSKTYQRSLFKLESIKSGWVSCSYTEAKMRSEYLLHNFEYTIDCQNFYPCGTRRDNHAH